MLAGRVQSHLQFDVQRARTNAAAVHRAQHLNVADRIEAEAAGNARPNQIDNARHGRFGIVRRHEIEVAVAFGPAQIGQQAPVDPVRAGDDPALGGLAEDLGQPHDRNSAGTDDVGQDLTRADRGSWSMSPTISKAA